MLKKISSLAGVNALTKNEQKTIQGGNIPVGCPVGGWGCTYQDYCRAHCGDAYCCHECPTWTFCNVE